MAKVKPKNIKESKSNLYYVNIISDNNGSEDRDGDYTEINHNISFLGYKYKDIEKVDSKYKVGSSVIWFKPQPKQPLFAVVVTYNAGDSFTNEYGCKDVVGLFPTIQDAQAVVSTIESHYKNHKEGNDQNDFRTFTIILPISKISFPISPSSWIGYFKTVTSIDIEILNQL